MVGEAIWFVVIGIHTGFKYLQIRMRNKEYQKQFKHKRTAIVESGKSGYQFKNKMEKCR